MPALVAAVVVVSAACSSSPAKPNAAASSPAPPASSSPSTSAPTSTLGKNEIRIFAVGSVESDSQTVEVTGAFADAGKLTVTGPTSTATLSRGTIQLDLSDGVAKEQAMFADINAITDRSNCGVFGVYTATVKFTGGTGAYRTLGGTATVTTTETGVFPQNGDGTCNTDGTPIGFLSIAEGTGTVTGL